MDALAALRLQMEWGADEALDPAPLDRFAAAPAVRPALRLAPAAPLPAPPITAPPAANLDELYAQLDAFEGCGLRATATTTVRPDGDAASGLVLIGEAPGADDDRCGRAFSGALGDTLDRVLGSIGLDRSAVLLTTLVPWRPPGNRPVTEAEIRSCLPFLLRLLALVRPQRMLLLGAAPVRVLTGNADPVRRLRGKWHNSLIINGDLSVPALPMAPLDHWLRSPTAKRETWADLLLLRSTLG